MQTQHLPAPLSWPQLPDEAAVKLHACLNDFLMLFESHYFGQIERFYHARTSTRKPHATQLRTAGPVPIGRPRRTAVLTPKPHHGNAAGAEHPAAFPIQPIASADHHTM